MKAVLARKWRPRAFTELVGQEHVVRALSNALGEGRLHHAYLFTGTRGVGKTTLARIIAKALNCEAGVTASPCGQCGACLEIDSGRYVDLIELDAASNTQVDNMRELLENAMYAPTAGRYKVYIIDEVHMLSRNAFNAMLKTLEEPPEHVKFVLATTDPQKIPVTVLSRCLQFNLKQIPQPQIQGRLAHILREEGLSGEAPALALIARAAQGSLRDALSLLDQAIAHGGGKVDTASTRAMLGAVDQTYLFACLRALAAGDGKALIAEADRMSERSLSFEMALGELATLIHRIALVQIVPDAAADDDPDSEALHELAACFGADDLQLHYQIAVQGRNEIGLAPDEYAGFTMTLLRMLAFAPADAGPGAARAAPAARPRAIKPAAVAQVESSSRPAPAPIPAPVSTSVSAPTVTSVSATTPVAARTPETAAAAAGVPAPLEKAAHPVPTGSWSEVIAQLGLTGMAKQLAERCELIRLERERCELRIPPGHETYLEKSYQERLKGALRKYLDADVQLTIHVGQGSGNSPADVASRKREEAQARAVKAIEEDEFVRELVDNFDARVDSIKPI